MIVATRLVIYSLLSKKSIVDIQDIKDTIIKLSEEITLISNSPEEIEEEINIVINQMNLLFAELGYKNCIEVKDGKIMVRNDCSQVIANFYEYMKERIKTNNAFPATYKMIISLLEGGENV